jgi:hypothetical protein
MQTLTLNRRRQAIVAVAILALLVVTGWSLLTYGDRVGAQTPPLDLRLSRFAVDPENGWEDIRVDGGIQNPTCSGTLPQSGPGIPASVIADEISDNGTFAVVRLRILDQSGAALNTPAVVTCVFGLTGDGF